MFTAASFSRSDRRESLPGRHWPGQSPATAIFTYAASSIACPLLSYRLALFNIVTLAGREKEVRFDAVLPRVEIVVAAAERE